MHTATASASPILAIDLGKYKSVACACHGDPAAARFESLTTDREEARLSTVEIPCSLCAPGASGLRAGTWSRTAQPSVIP